MKRSFWCLLLLLASFICTPIFAQEAQAEEDPKKKLHKSVEKAYKAYDKQEYTTAIELLKRAFTEVKGRKAKTEVLFKLAESYRMVNDYKNAQTQYEKAIKLGYDDPVAILYKADMLKAQGEYEEAIVAYQEYKQENPTDRRGEIGIESSKEAAERQNAPGRYQVTNMSDINSQYMDFSPIFGGKMQDTDVLIFASSREESTGKKEDGWTGQEFMDLYITNAERKTKRRRRKTKAADGPKDPSQFKWSTPVLLDEAGILNTKHNEGSAVYNSRKKDLYFTRCLYDDDVKYECGIWTTEMQGQAWKEPVQIIIGTDTTANVGQPSLSPDDKFLYFVSDDYNTKGKHDIFVTTFDRRSKTWNTPKNLGPKVNTASEEYYPFAHDDGYLYFASNGHAGMGGLDIFRIKVGPDGMPIGEAENMPAPINTAADDFGIIFQPGGSKIGFLSSNRAGSKSDDIYSIFETPLAFNLQGTVTSTKSGKPIPEVTVKLDGGGNSVEITSDKNGYYIFDKSKIKEGVTYTVSFSKKKFLNGQGTTTTVGVPLSSFEFIPSESQFLHTLNLNKALDPIEVPIVLPNVLFETAKWDLKPESQVALDTVVAILKNNPTIVIELRSHTDYTDTKERNQILSQHRADTCVKYLISKGIAAARLVPVGMGENEPFVIPENYKGYGAGTFGAGTRLSESLVKGRSTEDEAIGNQINRRTDMKILRDDYVPQPDEIEQPETGEGAAGEGEVAEEVQQPGEIYIVEGKESIGVIARKYKIKVADLKRLNGGLRGVRPFPGLQIKVEKDGNYEEWDAEHYQVKKRGESFKTVAKALELDRKVLKELNPDVDGKNLPLGLWLKIQ